MSIAILFECDAEGCDETATVRPSSPGAWADLEFFQLSEGQFDVDTAALDFPKGWEVDQGGRRVLCPSHR